MICVCLFVCPLSAFFLPFFYRFVFCCVLCLFIYFFFLSDFVLRRSGFARVLSSLGFARVVLFVRFLSSLSFCLPRFWLCAIFLVDGGIVFARIVFFMQFCLLRFKLCAILFYVASDFVFMRFFVFFKFPAMFISGRRTQIFSRVDYALVMFSRPIKNLGVTCWQHQK